MEWGTYGAGAVEVPCRPAAPPPPTHTSAGTWQECGEEHKEGIAQRQCMRCSKATVYLTTILPGRSVCGADAGLGLVLVLARAGCRNQKEAGVAHVGWGGAWGSGLQC